MIGAKIWTWRQDTLSSFCEHGNETSGSIKGGREVFNGTLSDHQLLKWTLLHATETCRQKRVQNKNWGWDFSPFGAFHSENLWNETRVPRRVHQRQIQWNAQTFLGTRQPSDPSPFAGLAFSGDATVVLDKFLRLPCCTQRQPGDHAPSATHGMTKDPHNLGLFSKHPNCLPTSC